MMDWTWENISIQHLVKFLIIAVVSQELTHYHIDFDPTLALEELLPLYLNFKNKYISQKSRVVYKSDQIESQCLPDEVRKIFAKFIDKVEKGQDLNPHSSNNQYGEDTLVVFDKQKRDLFSQYKGH